MLNFFILALVAAVAQVQGEHVLILTGGNFSETVKLNDKLVVEFYAPWCGHCKRLAPEYESAAESLKGDGIILANVDATLDENKALAAKYGVRGFPTLKIFRGDEEAATEYQGPRESDGIVSYLKSEFGPATLQLNSTDEVAEAKKPGDDVIVVGVFDGAADGLSIFIDVAEGLRGEAVFKHIVKPDLMPGAKAGSVMMFKSFDETEITYDGALEKGALTSWIEKKKTPKLVSLDKKAVNKKALSAMFANTDVAKLIGVLPIEDANINDFQAELIAISEANSDLHVLYLDPKENPGAMNFFGVEADQAPLLVVHAPADSAKYSSGTITISAMKGWVADFKAGKVDKLIKSADPPATNDGPVKVVVAKTFDDIVLSGKNVFTEFYAPWCGHCKKLEPIWAELGSAYSGSDSIVIAKMDATENDVPDSRFNVKGFPTLYFTSEKGEVLQYEGARTLEALKEFVDSKLGASDAKDEL